MPKVRKKSLKPRRRTPVAKSAAASSSTAIVPVVIDEAVGIDDAAAGIDEAVGIDEAAVGIDEGIDEGIVEKMCDTIDNMVVVIASWMGLEQTKYTQPMLNEMERLAIEARILQSEIQQNSKQRNTKHIGMAFKGLCDDFKDLKQAYMNFKTPACRSLRRSASGSDSPPTAATRSEAPVDFLEQSLETIMKDDETTTSSSETTSGSD